MAYKRILTIQDISCVGQCSMTVALPVLSACGHETCILPTAVLSTHTGGFGKPAAVNLDDVLEGMWQHWEENGITFDAVLVGYLGSVGAIKTTMRLLDRLLTPGGIVIVDPAMADNGRLYSGFDADYVRMMAGLCRRAEILLPNLTEASLLTGIPYQDLVTEDYAKELICALENPNVVLTGVGYTPQETGVLVREGERLRHYAHPRVEKSYHGTGDLFAACFTGALLQGRALYEAVTIAADFTCRSIQNSCEAPAHWYGVKFETALPWLIRRLER